MAFDGNKGQGQQHIAPASGGPQTPTQPMVAVWSMNINMALRQQYRSHTSTRFLEVAQALEINKVSSSSCPYEPEASTWPGAVAWTTDTNMASGGLSRRFNLKNKRSSFWISCHCSQVGQLCGWAVCSEAAHHTGGCTHGSLL